VTDQDRTRPIETAAARPEIGCSDCARCGAAFQCGAGERSCWCAAYPHLMPVPQGDRACYCPACLAEMTAHPAVGR